MSFTDTDPLLTGHAFGDVSQDRSSHNNNESSHLSDLELTAKKNRWSHFFHCCLLCAGFFLVFSPYNTIQNLLSSLIPGALGFWTLATVYLFFCLGALFVSPISVKYLSPRIAMTLGSITYALFLVSNLKIAYWAMIPAAALLGLGASVLWAGQGTYLTTSAFNYAIASGASADDQEKTKSAMGWFSGVFFSIFMSTQVFGNLIGSVVLSQSSNDRDLIYVLIVLASSSVIVFFLLPAEELPQNKSLNAELGAQESISHKILGTFRLWKDPKMLLLIFPIFYSGLELGWLSGSFTKEVVSVNLGKSWVGYVMATYGATDTIFSLLWGVCADFHNGKIVLFMCGVTIHALFFCFYEVWASALHIDRVPTWVIFVSAAIYGIGDAVWQTLTSVFISVIFTHDLEAGFSNLKLWSSLGFAFAFLIGPYLTFVEKVAIVLGTLVISAISIIVLYRITKIH